MIKVTIDMETQIFHVEYDEIRYEENVSFAELNNLLSSALESGCGSNYWIEEMEKVEPKEWKFFNEYAKDKGFHYAIDYPFNNGGQLKIKFEEYEEEGEKEKILDIDALRKGLELFIINYYRNYKDFRDEQYDADDGDAFLQLCLFGDIIFG